MRDEFIRFRNYKSRVVLRFRVRCVWALSWDGNVKDNVHFNNNISRLKQKQ